MIIFGGMYIIQFKYPAIEERLHYGFGEFGITMGTLLLALYTYLLGRNEIDDSKMERRMLRLKEKLEFYALLMPYINSFTSKESFVVFDSWHKGLMEKIQPKYEVLASLELRKLLRRYYNRGDRTGNWNEIIDSMHDIILKDFKLYTDEYDKLTS